MTLGWFISVDDHLIEPARLWQERLPQKWRDTGPRIVREGTSEFWVYEDRQIVTTGLNAVAGKSREEFSPEPISYEDMRPGCYEPAARVADMNQGLVLSSILFPSFPRYCGQVFHEAKDKELALLGVQAWNDFILEDFAAAYPGRFIPMMIIPLWDPVAAAAEIRRTAARGAKSIAFSENPTKLGLPSIHTDFWDPMLDACNETGFVVSMHVGSSSNLIRTSPDMPTLAFMAYSAAANQAGTLLDWLFSGKFEKFPNLKIALSEGSIGWIPYFLERAEQVIDKQRFWASRFDIDMNASHERGEAKGAANFNLDTDIRQLFRDHVFGTFIEDAAGIRLLDIIGEDNVMLECDYPHSDSTWPDTSKLASGWLAHLSEDVQHKIAVGNACRVYDFTPADPATIEV
ncbi:Predicted metal-dependent hydrolase, TIM-barrel fold [Parafrankia irregularis]|uniref:Predicted metal-dependent hydrolase, TIM-barrel fold n=1 Tax=Parafrankia irregularis TaxID=795642 RepID=A0A0S4QKG1_9ACTN|nr:MULTISPECIES: amidohydrolase family protein [Parafrankia]MBE3203854.1 amidohydrolase [Parafrankia sp. CH37]CUU55276.1 Predicted metal-dependent hydrolase, TIM-barrel fold [Parafrankia irregularis]